MTPAEHYEEAERLTYVIDDVLQSGAKRSIGDVIALARLHLDMAQAGADPAARRRLAGGQVSVREEIDHV
jgi:hypothetical protein